MSVDDAARLVVEAGKGAFLAEADIKLAYRIVPVHPEDHLLLGMVWDDSLFVGSALPFGLRSAPRYLMPLRTRWNGWSNGKGWSQCCTILMTSC